MTEENVVRPLMMTKIGRNDPCSCGSGRKYKLCCGRQQSAPLPEALFLSGTLARQSGELEIAVDFFRRTLRADPRHAAAPISLGNVLHSMGRLDAAAASYRGAILAHPDHFEAHANLGNVLQAQGRLEDALASYTRALAIQPDSAEILGNLGNVLQAQGSFDAAVASYRKALAIKPDSAELLSNLGVSLQSQGQLDAALECITKALAIKPGYAAAHYNLGLALQALGKTEAAVESYRETLRIMPGNALAHANLAAALESQGKAGEAVASYRQAIAINPSLVAAHNGLSALLSARVPLWHVPMMNDAQRNDAYFQALKAAITAGSHVLEIGTGSGLLSMMAARLGAKTVTTCEAEPLIAASAERVIADNGLERRISVVAKMSNDLTLGTELTEAADILVSEILSSELLGERVLPSIEDARRRLVKPGGRLIPAAGSIMLALFGGEAIGSNVVVEDSCGFNLRQFNAIVQKKQGISRNDLDIEMLSEDVEAFRFDFQNQSFHPGESKLLRIPVKAAGRCYGIIQWIRLQMDENAVFENHPSLKAAASGWQHLVYLFPAPVELSAGQTARVAAVHNRIYPWFSLEGIG